MPITSRPVQLSEVDLEENWSLLPQQDRGYYTHLKLSIEKVGLLHPPLLQEKPDGKYRVLHGRNRIKIAFDLQKDSLVCHILPVGIEAKLLFETLLIQHQLTAPLSCIEQAYFIRLCLNHMDINDVMTTFLPMLGYSHNKNVVTRLLKLLDLEPSLQLKVHQQIIGEKTAHALLSLHRADRKRLSQLFLDLNLGQGKQKRLLTLCQDISRRHGKSIESLLDDNHITQILHQTETNTPQKSNRLFAHLQTLHSPRLHDAKVAFKQRVQQLNLPKTCTLEHSPFFETEQIRLIVTFSDEEEFQKKWKKMGKLLLD